jgi:cell division protease FtsH
VYSEQTARLVDEEIRKLVGEALDRAREVLHNHRDKVEALAARLLATEVIEEESIRNLLGPKVLAPGALLSQQNHAPVEVRPEPPADEREVKGLNSATPWTGGSDA